MKFWEWDDFGHGEVFYFIEKCSMQINELSQHKGRHIS